MKLAWRIVAAILLIAGMAGVFYVYIIVLSTGTTPILAGGLAFACMMTGVIALYAHAKPEPTTRPKPYVQVDWHLSDVCLLMSCSCNPTLTRHVDGYNFGRLRCPDCGERFELPTRLEAQHMTE